MNTDPPFSLLREALAQVEWLVELGAGERQHALDEMAHSLATLMPLAITLLRAAHPATRGSFLERSAVCSTEPSLALRLAVKASKVA